MKIEQSCADLLKPVGVNNTIPVGTVFRYGDMKCGPYLQVEDGIVSFKTNKFHPRSLTCSPNKTYPNYTEYPNARVVLT